MAQPDDKPRRTKTTIGRVLFAVTGIMAGVTPALTAQTNLLVVSANNESQDHMRTAAGLVRWSAGATSVRLFPTDALRNPQADAISGITLVVPVVFNADEANPEWLESFLAGESIPRRHVATAVIVATTPVLTAAKIERAALQLFEELSDEGALPLAMPAYRLSTITVTATRSVRDAFDVPASTTSFTRRIIDERSPDGVVDLVRPVPGLDVVGVGTSQPRPIIRGLLGQRILLLEDGIRLGNSRRAQDQGELPALVDISAVDRVEVLRGAASVLYGSDAVGGIINIQSAPLIPLAVNQSIRTNIGYRYSTADGQHRPFANVTATHDKFAVRIGGAYRKSEPYNAPTGDFGDVSFATPVRVEDTGVEDFSVNAQLAYQPNDKHRMFMRYQQYRAEETGFGFVEPSNFSPDASRVQLLFPLQKFRKLSAGYTGTDFTLPIANEIRFHAYGQSNARDFHTNVFTPLPGPPGASVAIESRNFTDLDTYGFRMEAIATPSNVVTYTWGADFFRDQSKGTDTSTTTTEGFGPTTVRGRGGARVPFATYTSVGVFAQADINVMSRLDAILGVRYHNVVAASKDTPGVDIPLENSSDGTFVGSANLLFHLTDGTNLVASVGRAFRSPNLVERFFNGASPEGRGFWIRNPVLSPETSLNAEFGIKVRKSIVEFSSFVFRNTINDGIAVQATGDSVSGVAEFQHVNIDRLRVEGVEVAGGLALASGFSATAGFSYVTGSDLGETTTFSGEGSNRKATVGVRYADPSSRYWFDYDVRYNGSRSDVDLGNSFVGDTVPAFTVHTARAGIRLFDRHNLTLAVENLTNRLYAESSNVAFFRPEPGRNVIFSWVSRF